MSKKTRIMYAKTSFWSGSRFIPAGTLVLSTSELADGKSGLFADITDMVGVDYEVVETATAAPGERRVRPRSKASTKES